MKLINFFKKYNYNLKKIVGIKEDKKYLFLTDKKVFLDNADEIDALFCSYIKIEDVIFYSFELEKSILEKVELDSFVETKVYEEAIIDEIEEYEIKYKIVDKLKNNQLIKIEVVIVPSKNIYKDIDIKTIDYISFPLFSYEALYQENFLQKRNDLFILFLKDKIFLTFYSEGKLVSFANFLGGLESLFEKLKNVNLDLNYENFKNMLITKGLNFDSYKEDIEVLEILKEEFSKIAIYISNEIFNIQNNYDIKSIDRIFISGNIEIKNLKNFLNEKLKIETLNLKFNTKFKQNEIDPFLLLSIIETFYAYKNNKNEFNFSKFVRTPTFFYRPSGVFVISIFLFISLFFFCFIYLYFQISSLNLKTNLLQNKVNSLKIINASLDKNISKLITQKEKIDSKISKYNKEILFVKALIKEIYNFKFNYSPKSKELVKITNILNSNKVFIENISFKDNMFVLKIFSIKQSDIPHLVNDLVNSGFSVGFDKLELKHSKFYTTIRIKN